MKCEMKKVFVCSPYRGNIEENTKKAAFAARVICNCGHIPVVPHLYFPQFLDDNDQFERSRGIECGIELMKACEQLWLIGLEITQGMEYELEVARKIRIPVILYDEKLRQLNPTTLALDERVDNRFLNIINKLNCE
jgi:hypothetical protein